MKNLYTILFGFMFTISQFAQNETIFYEDFEDGLTGWTAKNLADTTMPALWRITNTRSVSPVHSAAWNDSTLNSYPGFRYDVLESPAITIPYNSRTFVSFKAFIHLTLNGTYYHDYFFVKYTTNNGNTWNNFSPYAVSGQVLAWRSFPEDFGPTSSGELTYWAGKTMKFRFITASDSLDPNGLGVFLDDFHVYTQLCEFADVNEPNNSLAQATPVELGDILNVALCPQNDEDFYKFNVEAGGQLNIVTQHNISYTYLYLMNSSGFTLKYAYNEMTYNITASGTYYLRVIGSYNYSAAYSIYFNSRPEPDILSVTDIPADNGLKVRVRWQASFYDPQNSTGQIKEYQLWRKITDTSGSQSDLWEHIAVIPAVSNRPFVNYTYVSTTLQDSILTTFRIAAIPKNESQAITWGQEGSGFSIDNLSPVISGFAASLSGSSVNLTWYIVGEDISSLKIYKGIYEIFPPLVENQIANLPPGQNNFTDTELRAGYSYYYIISAEDKSGNISFSPAIYAGKITGTEEDNILPADFSLGQNYPNPFNPATIITYSVPVQSFVQLIIYDALGREIETLINEEKPSGYYNIVWNAEDFPSGIYFYRIQAGEYIETRKMIVLK